MVSPDLDAEVALQLASIRPHSPPNLHQSGRFSMETLFLIRSSGSEHNPCFAARKKWGRNSLNLEIDPDYCRNGHQAEFWERKREFIFHD